MGSRSVVLLVNGSSALYLTGAKYRENGCLLSGYVENGCWDFSIKHGWEYAGDTERPVNKWPARDYEIIDAKGQKGDYNEVMQWAESQSKYRKSNE